MVCRRRFSQGHVTQLPVGMRADTVYILYRETLNCVYFEIECIVISGLHIDRLLLPELAIEMCYHDIYLGSM